MLRKLLMALLFVATTASAGQIVTVTATGADFEQAKNNALRQAVSQRAGDIILSHRIAENGQMVHNRIVNVASGYVENWTLQQREILPDGRMKITVDVDVNENRIVHKISEPVTGIDDRVNIQKQKIEDDSRKSYHDQRQGALRLVEETIRVYNGNYFTLEPIGRPQGYGTTIEQDFRVKWNPDFLDAFEKSVKVLADIEDRWDEFHKLRFNERRLGFSFSNWSIWSKQRVFRDDYEVATFSQWFNSDVPVCVEAVGTGMKSCTTLNPWRYTVNVGNNERVISFTHPTIKHLSTVTLQFHSMSSGAAYASAARLSGFKVVQQ